MPVYPGAQWVLSLPKRLRWYLYRNPALSTLVLEIFLEEIERALHRGAPKAPAGARFGAIACRVPRYLGLASQSRWDW